MNCPPWYFNLCNTSWDIVHLEIVFTFFVFTFFYKTLFFSLKYIKSTLLSVMVTLLKYVIYNSLVFLINLYHLWYITLSQMFLKKYEMHVKSGKIYNIFYHDNTNRTFLEERGNSLNLIQKSIITQYIVLTSAGWKPP